jgi:hypothetical protein
MVTLMRRWSAAALLAAGGAVLISFNADSLFRRGLDFGELASLNRELDETSRMDRELECRRELVMRRYVAKEQAVRELLAGRLTLLQTAARFRDVEESLPVTWGPPRRASSGPAEAERLCRDVMAWAHGWVEENLPAQAAEVAACLEAELQQHRSPDGAVYLPD